MKIVKIAEDRFEVLYEEPFPENERAAAQRTLSLLPSLMQKPITLLEAKIDGNKLVLNFESPFDDAIAYLFGEIAARRFTYRGELLDWVDYARHLFPERTPAYYSPTLSTLPPPPLLSKEFRF